MAIIRSSRSGGIIFTIIGVLITVGGVWYTYRELRFVRTSLDASGTVISLNAVRGSKGKMTYHPEIRYITKNGQTIEFQSASGSNPPDHRTNDVVNVLYDPANPYHAEINSPFILWFPSCIMLLLGLVFTITGIGSITRFQNDDQSQPTDNGPITF